VVPRKSPVVLKNSENQKGKKNRGAIDERDSAEHAQPRNESRKKGRLRRASKGGGREPPNEKKVAACGLEHETEDKVGDRVGAPASPANSVEREKPERLRGIRTADQSGLSQCIQK